MPSALAPTSGRVISKVASALDEPARSPLRARSSLASSLSSPPSRFSSGMRQSSRISSVVCEARMPSLSSFLPWLKPGVPFSTMKDAWPRPSVMLPMPTPAPTLDHIPTRAPSPVSSTDPTASTHQHAQARTGPPAKVVVSVLLLALACFAVGFWVLTQI